MAAARIEFQARSGRAMLAGTAPRVPASSLGRCDGLGRPIDEQGQ